MKRSIIIILAILFNLNLFSQEVLSLEAAIGIALENNHGIIMAKNNAQMMDNMATPGNAGLLPRVDLSAGLNYANGETVTNFGNQDYETSTGNAGLSLSYTLFDGKGTIYNFKSLRLNAENGELQAKYLIENTILQMINSYYILASYKDNARLMKEMMDISSERLARAQNKKEYGSTSGLNVLSAQVDYNNDSITYLKAVKVLEQSKKSFNVLLGRNVSIDFAVDAGLLTFGEYEYSDLLNSALQNNSDYKLTTLEVDQAELDRKIAGTNLFPTLSLSSSYGYNQSVDGFSLNMNDPLPNFTTGLTLSYNLFNGGKSKINRQNARLSLENSRIRLDEEKLTLERDLANALLDYENSLQVLAAEQLNIHSAQLNFDQSKAYYELGQISSTQFREAQLNLISAKNNIQSATYNAKIAETELKKSSGVLVF
jgi:outer membrane protein